MIIQNGSLYSESIREIYNNAFIIAVDVCALTVSLSSSLLNRYYYSLIFPLRMDFGSDIILDQASDIVGL